MVSDGPEPDIWVELAGVVDICKNLERAILADAPDDIEHYVEEAAKRRRRLERTILSRPS